MDRIAYYTFSVLQHAVAVSEDIDKSRPISDAGRADAQRMATHLSSSSLGVIQMLFVDCVIAMPERNGVVLYSFSCELACFGSIDGCFDTVHRGSCLSNLAQRQGES